MHINDECILEAERWTTKDEERTARCFHPSGSTTSSPRRRNHQRNFFGTEHRDLGHLTEMHVACMYVYMLYGTKLRMAARIQLLISHLEDTATLDDGPTVKKCWAYIEEGLAPAI